MSNNSSPGTIANTIIPMVRKIIPSMIANDIIGVQPMTGPSGQIFSMRSRFGKRTELDNWLDEMFPPTTNVAPHNSELEKYLRDEKPQAIFN